MLSARHFSAGDAAGSPRAYLEQGIGLSDDVIVLDKDFSDGLGNLRTALKRFREHSLKLKPKKCDLFRNETGRSRI